MSPLFRLNVADFGKGLFLVVILAVLQGLQVLLEAKGINVSVADFSPLLDIALKTGLAYILKNVFSDSQGNPLGYKI